MTRRNKKKKEEGGKAPGWITTFSDLMSLLLTFFVLLYSMSTMDAEKFKNIATSLQSVLSGAAQPSIIDGSSSGDSVIDMLDDLEDDLDEDSIDPEILDMYEKVSSYLEEEGLQAEVSVTLTRQGVFVELREAILFDPGSAVLKDSGVEVLSRLEGLINDFNNKLVVEGHTDNIPQQSFMYPSNWELSTARAVAVVRYLSEEQNIDPGRFSARGYGEHSPRVPNDSPENRAVNRRVNILIIFDEESDDIYGEE